MVNVWGGECLGGEGLTIQIVRFYYLGAKLSTLLSWCQIVRCLIVRCQIVLQSLLLRLRTNLNQKDSFLQNQVKPVVASRLKYQICFSSRENKKLNLHTEFLA